MLKPLFLTLSPPHPVTFSPEKTMTQKHVLILCTGNSCRSQMAEGLINHDLGDTWQAYSAGTEAVGVCASVGCAGHGGVGIDISDGFSKSADQFRDMDLDLGYHGL
jgi:arsenate reductase